MTTPAFHGVALRRAADVVDHAKATSEAAAHATDLIDEAIADAGWKGDLIAWVRSR